LGDLEQRFIGVEEGLDVRQVVGDAAEVSLDGVAEELQRDDVARGAAERPAHARQVEQAGVRPCGVDQRGGKDGRIEEDLHPADLRRASSIAAATSSSLIGGRSP
jgi:hypothetical protein